MVKVWIFFGLFLILSGCSIAGPPIGPDSSFTINDEEALENAINQELKPNHDGDSEIFVDSLEAQSIGGQSERRRFAAVEELISAYRDSPIGDERILDDKIDLAGFIDTDVDVSIASFADVISLLGSDILGLMVILGQDLDLSELEAPSISFPKGTSRRKVFTALTSLIDSKGMSYWVKNKILYVDSSSAQDQGVDIAIGRNNDDVPVSSSSVLQIVPVENQWDTEIDKLVSEFTDVSVSRSASRNAYIFRGRSSSVRQALRLVQALDTPSVRGKFIRRFSLTHVAPSFAAREAQKLLAAEGTASSILSAGTATPSTLLFVPLDLSNSLIIFSSSDQLIKRARYWLSIVDVPQEKEPEQFYIFRPKLNSADSILQTLTAFSVDQGGETVQRDNGELSSNQAPLGSQQVRYKDVRLMSDKNTGGILVQSSPAAFARLKPLLNALDVAPRQILLEVTIAEVSMQDEFKFGFEWALSNRGINYSTVGGFGAGDISGFSVGIVKDKLLQGRAFSGSGLIDVLSSPTLLVKEGVPASVSVGSRISVVGATTFDPLVGVQRQTTAAEYIDTGVSVDLTPTLVGSDVVEIDISQSISNTVSGTAGAGGNPDIFDRSLNTRVLARSGETILLGGLISDRMVGNKDGIPIVSKIPILGGLFGAQSRQKETTELIMIVTPTVLLNSENWGEGLAKFREGLKFIEQERVFEEQIVRPMQAVNDE